MRTPCIKICKIKEDICIGCGRTLDQIRDWSIFTDEKRDTIMEELWQKQIHYQDNQLV